MKRKLISCLMVTSAKMERFESIKKSIGSFCRQTYPNKELVIILDSPSKTDYQRLIRYLSPLGKQQQIRIFDPGKKHCLGSLRNISIIQARGEILCQWDDDDLSHPTRVERQLEFLLKKKAGAVLLSNVLHYYVQTQVCYWTNWSSFSCQALPCTIMMHKNQCIGYRKLTRREDLCFLSRLASWTQVEVLNAPPFLYTYIFHGKNTWNLKHHLSLTMQCAEPIDKIRRYQNFLLKGMKEAGLDICSVRFGDMTEF